MPTPSQPHPFVIRPSLGFLDDHPAIRRSSLNLARGYANRRLVTDEHLRSMGTQLWNAQDVEADFDRARTLAGAQNLTIIIESDDAGVQQLPWETLCHPQYGFLGAGNGFTLLRRPSVEPADGPSLETGPLRVLLFTSLPDDLDADRERLDVEEVQIQILEALAPLEAEGTVELLIPDDGRLTTLDELAHTLQMGDDEG
jgi:hypothetical protein